MRILFFISYLFFFLPFQIVASSLQVARLILFSPGSIKPAIVAISLDLKSDWAITLLAHSITLTPGTLSLDLSLDKKTLFVHCLALENPHAFVKALKNTFEKKILKLERAVEA